MAHPSFIVSDMGLWGAPSWADRMDADLKRLERHAAGMEQAYRGGVVRPHHGGRLKPYKYIGCCATLNGKKISPMVADEQQVSYIRMRRNCDLTTFSSVFGYSPRSALGLTLKDDSRVSFHRSRYNGHECYYLYHSAIEWVWVRR